MIAPPPAGSLGVLRLHLRTVDSTSVRALQLAAAGAPHGTLVTANEQTAGRGRQGRTWSAPAGSALLMSLVLREPPPLLSLAAGVAVCDALGAQAQLKWPNDVVVIVPAAGSGAPAQLRKLAGILIDARPQEGYAVLGIGVNVALDPQELAPELRERAASLGLPPAAVEDVLGRVLAALDERLGQSGGEILGAFETRDALRGREVRWDSGRGRARGVDGAGRLLVATAGGSLVALDHGEVHLLAMQA